jgi:hypothetical protein
MEFKFEEVDLEGAYKELSDQITESFGATDFLLEKMPHFEYGSIVRNEINDWFDEISSKRKKLMSVRSSISKIIYWEYENEISSVNVSEITDNQAHIQ